MTEPDRVNLAVEGEVSRRTAALRDLFPEAFVSGDLDLGAIGQFLGTQASSGPERYGLSWTGKSEAQAALLTGSVATLRPDRATSTKYATARHLVIEGDNLEVLRLLQRGYNDRIDVIYIDPPYNTGKDFVYKDNFKQGLDAYLRLTEQMSEEGFRLSSNAETSGRFHSAWLTMMYPRLSLARNLLTQQGVFMVSIDDHEVANLRLLMDDVFGPENFIAELVWEKTRKNDATFFSVGHEYMLIYGRSKATLMALRQKWREEAPGAREIVEKVKELRAEHSIDLDAIEDGLRDWYRSLSKDHPSKAFSRYKHVDDHGAWRDRDISWPGGDGPRYEVLHPETHQPCAVPPDGWRFADPETMQDQIRRGLVAFRDDHTQPPFRKAYLIPRPDEIDDEALADPEDDGLSEDVSEPEADDAPDEGRVGLRVIPSVIYKQSQVASKQLKALMGSKVFDNPKDHEVLARLFNYVTRHKEDATYLDFFAGSGSTAEAVMRLNRLDGGSRRYICVQWPEPTKETSGARKAGYDSVFNLCVERISRAAAALGDGDGRRVLRLASSNFKTWSPDDVPDDDLAVPEHLELFADSLSVDADDDAIVLEMALKEGILLHESLHETDFEGTRIVLVGATLVVCLARSVTDDLIDHIATLGVRRVVMLESAFTGSDSVKSNAYYRLRDAGITLRTA